MGKTAKAVVLFGVEDEYPVEEQDISVVWTEDEARKLAQTKLKETKEYAPTEGATWVMWEERNDGNLLFLFGLINDEDDIEEPFSVSFGLLVRNVVIPD